jgi:hypothetical protein
MFAAYIISAKDSIWLQWYKVTSKQIHNLTLSAVTEKLPNVILSTADKRRKFFNILCKATHTAREISKREVIKILQSNCSPCTYFYVYPGFGR